MQHIHSQVVQTETVIVECLVRRLIKLDVMGQFSTSTLLVLLCVGVTLSVAVSDFDLLLEHVELLKKKIIHVKSGKLARWQTLYSRDGLISLSSDDHSLTEKNIMLQTISCR